MIDWQAALVTAIFEAGEDRHAQRRRCRDCHPYVCAVRDRSYHGSGMSLGEISAGVADPDTRVAIVVANLIAGTNTTSTLMRPRISSDGDRRCCRQSVSVTVVPIDVTEKRMNASAFTTQSPGTML